MNKKWIWITGVALVVIVGAGFAIRQLAVSVDAAAPPPETGDIVTAFVGDLSASASASGQVVAERVVQLALPQTGLVETVHVQIGDVVDAETPLVSLDITDLERNLFDAQQTLLIRQADLASLLEPASAQDVTSAEAALASAEASLADLLAGPSEDEIAGAEADVRAANADIAAASARLNDASGSGSPEEIQAAQIELQQAQQAATSAAEQHSTILVTEPNEYLSQETIDEIERNARAGAIQANAQLAAAEEALDTLLNGNSSSIASSQAGLSIAVAQRDLAQARLDQLLEGPSSAQIASAEAQVAQAEASLARLLQGPTDLQVTQLDVQVEQAALAVQRAENALANAVLEAPFAGVVTAVNVNVGEQANGVLIEMIDLDSLQVVLAVDEIDLADLTIGQPTIITLEAWPDTEIESEIETIAPKATFNNSGLVTYDVYLDLTETELPVRAGMTANAQMVTANFEDVLLVPNAAISVDREENEYTVNLVTENVDGAQTFEEIEVSIGLRDGQFTQITDGLQAGDELLIGDELPTFDFGSGPPPGARDN